MQYRPRRGLFAKYVLATTALICLVLVASNGVDLYVSTARSIGELEALQREQAAAAASRIELYLHDVVHQMHWLALPSAYDGEAALEDKRLDFLKLLHQVPAITEVAWLDRTGRERLNVSRVAVDRRNSGIDRSDAPFFREASTRQPFFSSLYFRRDTEPYMTISLRLASGGVVAAAVNLKFVSDEISNVRIGRRGLAFVTDAAGTLIAHPDMTLVLRKTSVARTPEFLEGKRGARAAGSRQGLDVFVKNMQGHRVLATSARLRAVGWYVFTELPRDEVLQPLKRSVLGGIAVLLAAVCASVVGGMLLARRMVRPIRALQAGAAAIGAGHLDHRIDVRTGDEIEALAAEFNLMSQRLRESYATLEHKVAQRTVEVSRERALAERASLAKSRFLAAASHDLRQPMHALNLYLGALATQDLDVPARRVLVNVRQCADVMSDLLEALLDISRLDAQAMNLNVQPFPVSLLLDRLNVEFGPQARAKGLRLRVARNSAWVCSDEAVVDRILRNLVSNAVRHSASGGVLVGCRRRGATLRIAVYDQGPGIPAQQHELIFEEFYQLGNPERDRGKGMGLGLSIVKRLAKLIDSSIALQSVVGRGSMFAIDLPLVPQPPLPAGAPQRAEADLGSIDGALVVVVDDDGMVLRAMKELLGQWGCAVVAATCGADALRQLADCARVPSLLVCDYRLPGEENGLAVVESIREEFNLHIPAVIVSGDALPQELASLQEADVAVLRKPVADRTLRRTVQAMLASWSAG